ncbi:MAG: excalibur calcium-binding domain-containing protein [Frankiaceae bacterium]|nr:excalibur calcium-binding domain-containing protein [Frankiaceae bacterium]
MRRGVVVAAVLAALMAALGTTDASASGDAHTRHEHGYPLPDRHATPGKVAHHAPPRKFCRSGYSSRHRSVSDSMRRRVFEEYGIAYSKHGHFEIDHLIPLELGGANGIKNLWPERGRIPNAKDGLENELHNRVCQGQLSARHARRAIARDWVKAMKHYGTTSYVYVTSGHHHGGGGSGGGGAGHGSYPRSWFTNCTAVNRHWPHGIGKKHAHDHTTGTPVTTFKHSSHLYRHAMSINSGLDGDKDGIACERA